MKKICLILGVFVALSIFLFSCDPREETKQPVACFDYFPVNDIAPGDEVTFTNCSEDTETYDWNFGDGSVNSVAKDPKHKFDVPGEYDVTLTVQNKNLKDQMVKTVTVISMVEACFTMSPNPAVVNENVTFTNCSVNADSYEWDIDGNGTVDSNDENPVFYYINPGTFTVKLTAKLGNSSSVVTHDITVLETQITIDPKVYNSVPNWETGYYNDFSAEGDFWTGSGDDYALTIANGYYTMVDNNTAEDHYGYYVTTDAYSLPEGNYDLDIYIRNTLDNGNFGSGLVYGADADYRNYFRFSIGYYYIGDSDGVWLDWTEAKESVTQGWNLLTVRKYKNKYYYFINEAFEYEDDYNVYGNTFGCIFDGNTQVDIDWISVSIMDLSGKKSGGTKQHINTPRKEVSGTVQRAPFAIKALN